MNIIKAGSVVADGASGVSVVGAMTGESVTAIAAAIVSVGAILIPRLIEWGRQVQAAKREEHIKDVEADSMLISKEVRRRAELEVKVKDLEDELVQVRRELEAARCPWAQDGQARCDRSKQPGEWLKDQPPAAKQ